MRFGHVLGDGRMTALAVRARMDGDAFMVEEAFDCRGRDADIELSFDERVRDAVVVTFNLDVIVNVDAGLLPFGVFVGLRGQRFERRLLERFELRMTRAWELFERLVIERVEQAPDGGVEISQSEEGLFAQPRQHPAFDDLDSDFDLGLVARLVRARWQGCRVVVFEHLGIGSGERGFIAAGFGDAALEIVRDNQSRDAAEELKGADVRAYPIVKLLREGRLCVSVVGGAEHSDEDVCVTDFAGQRVNDGNGRAAIVDEQLVAWGVRLAHRWRKTMPPFTVENAEVRIAVMPNGIGLSVFFPEKLKRDAFAAQLLMKLGEIR